MIPSVKSVIKNVLPYGLVKHYENGRQKNSIPNRNVCEPLLFNSNGERMRVFYLQDNTAKHSYSFTAGREAQKIFWDRDNYLLPVHFYSDEEIYRTKKTAQKCFGFLLEPEAFKPMLYKKLLESPQIAGEFDAIFTHSAKLLDRYKNAKLYLGQGVWYGTDIGGGELNPNAYKQKLFGVSMVSSDKTILESHRLRISIAKEMKRRGIVDTFGAFDGGRSIKIADALSKYRYSIVLENEISDYYFTEKILNCFAAMTIPIYAGAKKIGEYFNEDGIIQFDKFATFDEMAKTISKCTAEYYEEHIDAIIDNFHRVKRLLCIDDYIYEKYKGLFVI